jgi:rhodanese-related sulfurtransferase
VNPVTSPLQVRRALRRRTEIALLDLRPEGVFARGHPLFAASFPLDRLELEIFDRIPRLATPVVVYGTDAAEESRAVDRLGDLGYSQVSRLDGGLDGWKASGGEVFEDVNSPSKAFGELVEAEARTPAIDAGELSRRIDERADLVVVDARRFEEYHTMNIPTSTSVPGAELVLRVRAVAPRSKTLVVVNCAGRTRSIIGAQSLINAGLANPVAALRNGTIGWTLAGRQLEHGQTRLPPAVPAEMSAAAAVAARSVAERAGVTFVGHAGLLTVGEDPSRTLYRFDVRSPEEYLRGHPGGFVSAPGGQLVQETDRYAPVRGAAIALYDDDGVRAPMTASWLAQMGWNVSVLEHSPVGGDLVTGPRVPARPPLPEVAWVTVEQLDGLLERAEAQVIDVDLSSAYRRGHLPGASWILRRAAGKAGLLDSLEGPPVLAFTSHDDLLSALATADAARACRRPVMALSGGNPAWTASGRRLVTGDGVALSPMIDVYRRPYEGTDVDPATMQAYLDWEYGLVGQLQRDDTHGFWVLAPAVPAGDGSRHD